MLWTKLGMGLLGMAGKGLAGSGLLQTLSQGLGSGKGGGSGKGMGCGRGGSLHGSGMKGSRSGKDGKGCRQTDAPALDELLTGLLQRQTTVGETVRTFLPAASPHEAGAETIDVQALPAGAAASTAVDNTDMEAAMRALLGSIHHFSDVSACVIPCSGKAARSGPCTRCCARGPASGTPHSTPPPAPRC